MRRRLGGRPGGRVEGRVSRRLGGRPGGRVEGRVSRRLGGRPGGRVEGRAGDILVSPLFHQFIKKALRF